MVVAALLGRLNRSSSQHGTGVIDGGQILFACEDGYSERLSGEGQCVGNITVALRILKICL